MIKDIEEAELLQLWYLSRMSRVAEMRFLIFKGQGSTRVCDQTRRSFLFFGRYWEADLWDSVLFELLNAHRQATGTRGTRAVLTRLATSLSSYIKECKHSLQLRELLRKQDNMICHR